MDKASIRAATERVTARGQPYEVVTAEVDGVKLRVYKNAPANLRGLFEQSLGYADRDFYVYRDERYTFGEAYRTAAQVAHRLASVHGISKGDRVAIAMRNYPEWVFSYMGATSMGAVVVAMNAWWSAEELVYGLRDSGARLIIADSERIERLAPHLQGLGIEAVAVRCEAPLPARTRSWPEFLGAEDAASAVMTDVEIDPDDNATILYTSGSTAEPKGALATHRATIHAVMGWEGGAVIAAEIFPGLMDPDPEFPPAMILTVPLFHVTGLNVQLNSSFRGGRKLVAMYKWDAEEALRIIERERITQFNGVPTMSWELVQSPNYQKYDLRSLRNMGGGGAAMAPQHARQIEAKLEHGVAGTGYGLTETGGLATTIAGEQLMERSTSCGRPVPPIVDIKIAGRDGHELPRGEVGEIWIRGAMNIRGYWNAPEATAATITDGWVHSGDIGYMDAEDFVFITDREKDMVIRGGENIGCQEVEAVIYEHPAVSEVAVFGVPDERLGETLAAVIVVKPGRALSAQELKAHVGEHLASFKVPEYVFVRDERLPRIASEKIYKRGLREETIETLGRMRQATENRKGVS